MHIVHRYEIKPLFFPVDGYKFNAQVWISTDGGATFAYCGIGTYTRTEHEARAWVDQYAAEHPDRVA